MAKCFSHLLVDIHYNITACRELTPGFNWSPCSLLLYSRLILTDNLGCISRLWKTKSDFPRYVRKYVSHPTSFLELLSLMCSPDLFLLLLCKFKMLVNLVVVGDILTQHCRRFCESFHFHGLPCLL